MAFQPSDLSGLVAWYDAQSSATITLSGSSVTQWNDRSSTGVNVAQAVAANMPSYGATLFANTYGSFPGIRFTRANGQFLSASVLPFTTFSDFTVFVIANPITAGGYNTFYGLGNGGDEFDIALGSDTMTIFLLGATPGEADSNTLVSLNVPHYFMFQRNASNLTSFRMDGVADSAAVTLANAPITIGSAFTGVGGDNAGENSDAIIGEIVVYKRTLAPAEIAQFEAYAALKWGFTPAPVTASPLGGTMGADMGDYERHVRMYWERIEEARRRQQQKEDAQRQLEREASLECGRIHARMAELRAIKARKKADKERIAAEMLMLATEERKLKADLAAADAIVLNVIDYVNEQILLLEAYKRRYQASLIMLLLGVN